jgi:hypothetical protein
VPLCTRKSLRASLIHDEEAVAVQRHVSRIRRCLQTALRPVAGGAGDTRADALLQEISGPGTAKSLVEKVFEACGLILVGRRIQIGQIVADAVQGNRVCLQSGKGNGKIGHVILRVMGHGLVPKMLGNP